MLAGYFFRDTRALIMITLAMIIGGIGALWSLGRQEDPTITNRYASVTTLLPGTEPARIEALISTRIEDELRGIADIEYFSSASLRGASVVSVSVRDTLPADEIETVWIQLREAVARAQLQFPPGASEPRIDTEGVAAYTTVIAVELRDPAVSPAIAARFAEVVQTRLRDIPQTRVVRMFGQPEEEILVSVDPYRMGSDGISADQIAAAIAGADGRVLAGRYVNEGLDANVAVSGELSNLDEIRNIPLPGSALRVGDLAEVRRQAATPPEAIARSNGHQAILIGAVIEDGAQVDRWMQFVREDVAELSDLAPRGLAVDILFDQSGYTLERLWEVGMNMLSGMLIVISVLWFTLGGRAALIVALVLPVVTLVTLITFIFLDLPLHQMSIAGLIVSLGLVVDAAIITADTVRRRLGMGDTREEAAEGTARRLFMPLAASTVTTVLTFLPMILLPGNAGDFVRTIGTAVCVMLTWSFVLAIILTAPMAAHLLSPPAPRSVRTERIRHKLIRAQKFLILNPILSILLSLILPLLGFYLATRMTLQFFPLVERNQFHIALEMPEHSSIARTDEAVRAVDGYLTGLEGVTDRYWVSGGSAPPFYYNIPSGRANEPGYAQGMITTETPEVTRRLLGTLQHDLTSRFPEARIIVQALAQGPPVGAPVEILIFGPDLAELRRIGAEIQGAIAALPEAAQVRGGLSGGLPQLRFDIDGDAASQLGLNEPAIANQLQAGLAGLRAGMLVEGTHQIPILVQFAAPILQSTDQINDFPLVAEALRSDLADLPTIPLSAVAVPRIETTEALIFRSDGERMNFVQAYPQPDLLPEVVLGKALEAISAANIVIPEGYRLDIGGDSDERSSTVSGLNSSLLLILILFVASLIVTFRSFRLTAGTMIVAVLSTGLAFFSVAIMGFPFGINALIGVIGSIGVSVNASIIIFTALQDNAKAAAGDPDAAAAEVIDGALHISSTTLTTFGGFLPLIFSGGLFWPPFAAAVAGGVLLSATFAFTFAPAFFRLVYPPMKSLNFLSEPLLLRQPPAAAQYLGGSNQGFNRRRKHPLRQRQKERGRFDRLGNA